jgi:hypothetical protein
MHLWPKGFAHRACNCRECPYYDTRLQRAIAACFDWLSLLAATLIHRQVYYGSPCPAFACSDETLVSVNVPKLICGLRFKSLLFSVLLPVEECRLPRVNIVDVACKWSHNKQHKTIET